MKVCKDRPLFGHVADPKLKNFAASEHAEETTFIMAESKSVKLELFENLARAIANVPDKNGASYFHGDPRKRILWLNNLLDIDDSDSSDQEVRDSKKVEALKFVGFDPTADEADIQAIMEVLASIHTLQSTPPDPTSPHVTEYNEPVSFWRHAYDQFAKRLILARTEGETHIVNRVHDALLAHGNEIRTAGSTLPALVPFIDEMISIVVEYGSLADRRESIFENTRFKRSSAAVPFGLPWTGPPATSASLSRISTTASELGY